MNMMKWILTLLLLQSTLVAESLDPNRYQKIKRILSQTGHVELEDMKRSMESIVSYPAPYLRTLSEEPGVRIYVKERSLLLLSHYPDGESETFLKSNVANQTLHPSLRKFSARSYRDGFIGKKSDQVNAYLSQYSNDAKIGETVRTLLDSKIKKNFNSNTENQNATEDLHLKKKTN
ncbi:MULTISPECIES: hypothetical protein [Leptospira]|nr:MULTISPECIES: hypothetical protein [Leptospira]